jgi:flavodoxin
MDAPDSISRRRFVAPCALMPLAALATPLGAAAEAEAKQPAGSRVLVAYFSRSGNTRVIAGHIGRTLGAVVFEIQPAQPYPEDYFQTVEQARRERDSGFRPQLKGMVANLDAYDVVYLGFPIWGETAPPVIRAFLAAHTLAGKTVIPFITHGGYGLGDSLKVVAAHAPSARLLDAALVMQADQERQTTERVTRWLGDTRSKPRPAK